MTVERVPPDVLDQASTVSFSVDCDDIDHYRNFAPPGEPIVPDRAAYLRMCRTLARLFERHGITATFFCIADRLEDPETLDLFRSLAASGHRIANHTYSHPDMGALSDADQLGEIRRGHDVLTDRLHVRPVGYRGPAYHLNSGTLGELCRLGYQYDSSVVESALFQMGVRAMGKVRTSFVPKTAAPSLPALGGRHPSVVRCAGGGRLIEWPVPTALGLPFYGTMHSVLPRAVFFAQWQYLRTRVPHVHYELHPIEAIDADTAARYPWLPTGRISPAKRESWLDRRLDMLAQRRVVTLEELSAKYLPLLH
jgi:hypothetical protein